MEIKGTLVFVAVSGIFLSACARNEAATPPPPAAPQVTIAQAQVRTVTEFEEFTGRIEAVERVEIRPRVSGYLSSLRFTEGKEVRKGDVLFVVDPRPYAAELKRARAALARAVAGEALARSERERALKLHEARAISQGRYEALIAGSEQAAAEVEAARAAVEAAALNLSFTQIHAPISGIVARALVTTGNLVTAGETVMTTLVSVDPVYVVFDGEQQRVLPHIEDIRREQGGRLQDVPVWVGVAAEEGHRHRGTLVFLNNEIDARTGTIRVHGLLDNPDRRFTPGMFARIKLARSAQYAAVSIQDSAIGTDQNLRYAFVLDEGNRVQRRTLELGPKIDDQRVVRMGLKEGDRVITNGLQRVRPGMVVTPVLAPQASAAARAPGQS